jgi:hypothetical protein
MRPRLITFFLYSAGFLLFLTGIAKLIGSIIGKAQVLGYADPIFGISFRNLFLLVGGAELIVSAFCFVSKEISLPIGVVACLATNFMFYRIGMRVVGYQKPCPCVGNLTDALHIDANIAGTVMKWILAYLLVGSYALLIANCLKAKIQMRKNEHVSVVT